MNHRKYKICRKHGKAIHIQEVSGYYRCWQCRKQFQNAKRKNRKALLVKQFGNKCNICGYNKYLGALQFHHLDPKSKLFELGVREIRRSRSAILAEAKKCILLCANCHTEVENKITIISAKHLKFNKQFQQTGTIA
jgi:hypothetical protein